MRPYTDTARRQKHAELLPLRAGQAVSLIGHTTVQSSMESLILKRLSVEKLRRFCAQALEKAGLRPDDAAIVADVLVMTDTWGTFSHGTGALRNYLISLRAGGMNPHSRAEVVAEGDSWAVVDGHSGMGMLDCHMAMNIAIEKARTNMIRSSSQAGSGIRLRLPSIVREG